jgi:hypothetical protein
VLIGVPGPGFAPDLEVKAPPEADRQAYAALEAGVALAGLLTDHPGKVRQDELSLRQGSDSAPAPAPATGPGAAEPVIDAALQRAVHLHRAHQALRRG